MDIFWSFLRIRIHNFPYKFRSGSQGKECSFCKYYVKKSSMFSFRTIATKSKKNAKKIFSSPEINYDSNITIRFQQLKWTWIQIQQLKWTWIRIRILGLRFFLWKPKHVSGTPLGKRPRFMWTSMGKSLWVMGSLS